ncbi:MAG: polyprenyl synthetase family protein [Phycisphaerae bacterium]|nr:polyprenyl synthetase family protein [Phycisphaerae bacterium]
MVPKARSDVLGGLLAPYAQAVEADLAQWLVEPDVPAALAEAMRYCVLGGGKRLRPALVSMSAGAVGGDAGCELARRSAVAVELVHAYSLVHDDLPAMDDDVLRRGRPTVHVQFGQAMAILAGDALLTRAFGVLAESDEALAAALARELSAAAGPAGMIAGQVADMDLCPVPGGLEGLRYIHARKTAALIRGACRMGALCGRAERKALEAISTFGHSLGLAFQLADDLLDVTATAEDLGKTAGKDASHGKRTHAALIGLEASGRLGQELTASAIAALDGLGPAADDLRTLAKLLADRTR